MEKLKCDGSMTLIDVRTAEEFDSGHIKGFFNIPVDELREHIEEFDIRNPVYVVCQSGLRSYIACCILSQYGFECYNLSGGYGFYSAVMHEKQMAKSAYPCGMEKC